MSSKLPNFNKYKKRLTNINDTLHKQSDDIINGIVKRTKSGKDANNNSFKSYSDKYKKKGKVDLTVKGSMLNSVKSKKISKGISLYFSSANEQVKAYANQVKYGRKFFGLDKKQVKSIKTKLLKSLLK